MIKLILRILLIVPMLVATLFGASCACTAAACAPVIADCAGSIDTDKVYEHLNDAFEHLGALSLMNSYSLAGKREFGEDDYTGSYTAAYRGLSKRETLFGGTTLDTMDGRTLVIHCKTKRESGTLKLLLVGGAEDTVLFDGEGAFETELQPQPGSWYIVLETEDFTGSVTLTVADRQPSESADAD